MQEGTTIPNGGMSSTLSIHSGFVAGEVGLIDSDMGGDPVHKTQPHVPSNEFTECAFELFRLPGIGKLTDSCTPLDAFTLC